ncbi:MAG: endonuclease/exonuclease/phosphatase family protein, partial [Pseudomonadota bacterium]
KYKGYDVGGDQIAFAPNSNDGAPGQRRPGVAILSRFGFAEAPEIIQDLADPVEIAFSDMGGGDGGTYRMSRTSRPILKARIPMGGTVVSVFNCHLKSKLGEFVRPAGKPYAPEADLTNYDAVGRALGAARAAMRRMAEAWVLRRAIVAELEQGRPVMVMGDFNDSEHAVSTEIISGEAPFKNYSYMLRHDAEHKHDRYTREENEQIRENVEAMRLHSAETLFARKSLRDMVYTSTFGGIYESIDQLFLSRHFVPEAEGAEAGSLGRMEYFTILNDHLNDGSHPEAPHNKLISDHGQLMVHLSLKGG